MHYASGFDLDLNYDMKVFYLWAPSLGLNFIIQNEISILKFTGKYSTIIFSRESDSRDSVVRSSVRSFVTLF